MSCKVSEYEGVTSVGRPDALPPTRPRTEGRERGAAGASPGPWLLRVIEATYLYEVAPWWVLQPDIQMVINPFAGLRSPVNDRSLSNALATGLRMTVKF